MLHVDTRIHGIRITGDFDGTPQQKVLALRNHIAECIPHIMFTSIDDRLREQIDVDGKGDWTDPQFFAEVVKGYNGEHPDHPIKLPENCDCQGFLNMLIVLGVARET